MIYEITRCIVKRNKMYRTLLANDEICWMQRRWLLSQLNIGTVVTHRYNADRVMPRGLDVLECFFLLRAKPVCEREVDVLSAIKRATHVVENVEREWGSDDNNPLCEKLMHWKRILNTGVEGCFEFRHICCGLMMVITKISCVIIDFKSIGTIIINRTLPNAFTVLSLSWTINLSWLVIITLINDIMAVILHEIIFWKFLGNLYGNCYHRKFLWKPHWKFL